MPPPPPPNSYGMKGGGGALNHGSAGLIDGREEAQRDVVIVTTLTAHWLRYRSWSSQVHALPFSDPLPSLYRIMYELAVCSDGLTSAQPRSFHQNRPASDYAHSPANRCSAWLFEHVHLNAKKKSFDNLNAALTGQVQVLVTLTKKHDWARRDPQVWQAQLCYKYPRFSSKKRLRQGLHCTQEVRKSSRYQLVGVGVHQLRALAPVYVVLLWTPSCILSRRPR